LNYVDIQ